MAEHLESPHVQAATVSYTAAGILAFLFATLAILAFSFPGTISKPAPIAAAFPVPSVRTDERAQRLDLEAQQRARLAGKDGAIPIERAMDMIVERGAKAFDPVAGLAP